MLNEDGGILIKDAETTASLGFSTVPGMLIHGAGQRRKPDAFKFKRGGQWVNVSTEEFLLRVEELSLGLQGLGIKAGDRVAIMSENRLEWAIADYAALSISAITVPIYPTLSAPQVEALICDCEPALIFVSTAELLEKVLSIPDQLPKRRVVAFEPIGNPHVMQFDALYELGRQAMEHSRGQFRRNACAIGGDQVATIIYTSGTSGVPKVSVRSLKTWQPYGQHLPRVCRGSLRKCTPGFSGKSPGDRLCGASFLTGPCASRGPTSGAARRHSRTVLPTGLYFERSGSGSAGGCGSLFPAARPWNEKSPNFSGPWDCRFTRDMD